MTLLSVDMGNHKQLFSKCGLLAGGCLIGLLVAESGLRLLGYRLGTSSAYQPDPYCGARLVPGFRGWHTKEGRVWIEINSHGFRDRQRSYEKPPDTFRIAVIGDSYAEALQVTLDETFWSVMERKLSESPWFAGQRVEVLNFGVSGYGTAQELEMLRHYVWDYEPDLILLEFFAANDVANNSRRLEKQTGRPFYTLVNDRLKLDNSFLQDTERVRFQTSAWIKLKDSVVHHSRVAMLIYQFRNRQRSEGSTDGEIAGLNLGAFRQPITPDWIDAWAVTDQLVVEIATEAASHGAKFVVLMANTGIEVEPDDAVFQRAIDQLGVTDFLYPTHRLEELGAKHGFTVICMAQAMREAAKQRHEYMHGFPNTHMGSGHWNATGHRLAGELATEGLLESESGVFETAPMDSEWPIMNVR